MVNFRVSVSALGQVVNTRKGAERSPKKTYICDLVEAACIAAHAAHTNGLRRSDFIFRVLIENDDSEERMWKPACCSFVGEGGKSCIAPQEVVDFWRWSSSREAVGWRKIHVFEMSQ